MAGFFDDIGEFFTGNKANKAEQQTQQLANDTYQQQQGIATKQQGLADQANQQAAGFDAGASQSMGSNAADYMQRADAAANQQAGTQAANTSIGDARNALLAARSAGLNRGQAAVQAGQTAADSYSGNLNNDLNSARNQYQQATQQFANRGDSLAARGMGYQAAGQQARQFGYNAKAGGNTAATNFANQSAQAGGGFLSGLTGGIANKLGFAKGTDDAPGGDAVVGELGAEAMETPGGAKTVVGAGGPEVADVPAGSKIIPHGKVDQALLNKALGKKPTMQQLLDKACGRVA